jgi:hypothetical protein
LQETGGLPGHVGPPGKPPVPAAEYFRRPGRLTSSGIDELDQALDGVKVCTVFWRNGNGNVELLSDQFPEGNEIDRGHAQLKETAVQIFWQIGWTPIHFEVRVDELSDTFFGRGHGHNPCMKEGG